MAAILFTACTQDELAEQGNTLPDGEISRYVGWKIREYFFLDGCPDRFKGTWSTGYTDYLY